MIIFELRNLTGDNDSLEQSYILLIDNGSFKDNKCWSGEMQFTVKTLSTRKYIYIDSLHINRKYQHTDKHYGQIMLDYVLNHMFPNLQETHKTIKLEARPFHMSHWRIIKKHIDRVNIPELLKYYNVESLDKVTKTMIDDDQPSFSDEVRIYNLSGASKDELSMLVNFYKRFGFAPVGQPTENGQKMTRPNMIIPVPGLVSYTAKLNKD
jgi:hypothetical protein